MSINQVTGEHGRHMFKGMSHQQIKNRGIFEMGNKDGGRTRESREAREAKRALNNPPVQAPPVQDELVIEKPENQPNTLSEGAQEYLAKLQEKFGDVAFNVVHGEFTDNMRAPQSGAKYNCFISADLLEQMAADEEVAAKYEKIIEDATVKVDEIKEEVKEKGLEKYVHSYNVKVDKDGNVSYGVKFNNPFNAFLDKTFNWTNQKAIDREYWAMAGRMRPSDLPNEITTSDPDKLVGMIEDAVKEHKNARREEHMNLFNKFGHHNGKLTPFGRPNSFAMNIGFGRPIGYHLNGTPVRIMTSVLVTPLRMYSMPNPRMHHGPHHGPHHGRPPAGPSPFGGRHGYGKPPVNDNDRPPHHHNHHVGNRGFTPGAWKVGMPISQGAFVSSSVTFFAHTKATSLHHGANLQAVKTYTVSFSAGFLSSVRQPSFHGGRGPSPFGNEFGRYQDLGRGGRYSGSGRAQNTETDVDSQIDVQA